MIEKTLEPITADLEQKPTGCYPLLLDAEVGAVGIILKLANSTTVLPDIYEFWTDECARVSITVRFPSAGGTVTVGVGTADARVHADTDGDLSVSFERASPDEFDVDVSIKEPVAPRSSGTLRPKPVVPSRKVKLVPKIGCPPPDTGEK